MSGDGAVRRRPEVRGAEPPRRERAAAVATRVAGDAGSPWLRSFRSGPPGSHRVVCFPHAGGGAGFYRGLVQHFPAGVDVRVVQYPGRETRIGEPLVDDMPTLADAAAEAVAPLCDRPVAVFGHSMGASVAYEVVRRLEATGAEVDRLFVSARQAPGVPPARRVHHLPDGPFTDVLRAVGGTVPSLLDNPEMREYLLPIVRNDYRLIETYRPAPGPRLRTGVVALAGADDPTATTTDIHRWAAVTGGGFEAVVFPGGHFYLLHQAAHVVAALLAHLCWTPAAATG